LGWIEIEIASWMNIGMETKEERKKANYTSRQGMNET
jgi:hypothetical protein